MYLSDPGKARGCSTNNSYPSRLVQIRYCPRAFTVPIQDKKTRLALFVACIIYTLPDHWFYKQASTMSLKLFHVGTFLVTLLVCPGSWLWHVLVLALHSLGTGFMRSVLESLSWQDPYSCHSRGNKKGKFYHCTEV